MFYKKFVKCVCVVLSACMVLLAAGCGKKTGNTDNTEVGTQEESGEGLPIVKQPITLKILSEATADVQLGNDMPVYKELEKRTNIKLDWQFLPVTNGIEKFNLVMASGDLPDIVAVSNQDSIIKYGTEGALIPVQDLIKQYAPEINRALDNPLPKDKLPYKMNAWAEITNGDGNVYTIPSISASTAIGAVFAIREDWLEKLNLKTPETLDDLYTALKAFKEKDPNGNGKADEIPFVAGQGNKTATILPLINAFGAHMNLYIDKSGEVKYGPVEAKFKEALQFLNKLYKEGLLEPDYLTSTKDQWTSKVANNQAGFMFVWPASGIGASNTNLAKLDPSYRFVPIAPVKGPYGDRYKDNNSAGKIIGYKNSITKANKHPVETIKYLDYCFTEDATILFSYGVENIHYKMVNGSPEYTDMILKNQNGLDPEAARTREGICWSALPFQIGWEPHIKALKDSAPMTIKSWELYREPGMVETPFPTLKFSEEEFSKKNQIITEINTYKDAMIDKFIMGVETLDKFDEFVSKINRAGLPELLKISNEAYERYKKFGSK